jgi:hypothetical protein
VVRRQYWIKLWLEILEDEKVSPLPDRLWRRFVEVCLVASAAGQGGALPDVSRIAWYLRLSAEETESDLVELARHSLVEQRMGVWWVPNFAKRQAPKGGADRQRRSRRWREDVTAASQSADTEDRGTEEQKTEDRRQRTEEDQGRTFGAVIHAWESLCGPITTAAAEQLNDLADEAESRRLLLPAGSAGATESGPGWLLAAIEEATRASTNGRVSVNFVNSILSRWYRDGFKAAFRKVAKADQGGEVLSETAWEARRVEVKAAREKHEAALKAKEAVK